MTDTTEVFEELQLLGNADEMIPAERVILWIERTRNAVRRRMVQHGFRLAPRKKIAVALFIKTPDGLGGEFPELWVRASAVAIKKEEVNV